MSKRKLFCWLTISNFLYIVVLLILAGVSIATLTGENGILTQAQKSKEATEQASIDEQRKLAQVEASMNLKNTEYKGVTIPAGFAPTRIEGEDTVEDGLVITDSKGNEFVWIPVADETPYVRNTTYANTNVSASAEDDSNYLPTGITIPEDKEEVEIEEELVKNAGGFYIARYEAGKEGTATLVSKKGANVWIGIPQTDLTNNNGAKEVSKTFINNDYVKSGLITGIQWDMAMKYISSQARTDGTGKTYNVTVASSTRHKRSGVEVSGNNEADKVCNIYDLEGNTKEYIAEKCPTYDDVSPCVNRGGSYDTSGFASVRGNVLGRASRNISFRFVLYVM